ncbi:hypothetical protein [Corallincola spongiicola]|uniref:Uncharacterized protein n=1 Tax=Corallincola spongiicola TaxID=2520508 RepID=A0ABY1WML6_9GAMM|nr:hypothetical protein [Corallincola spongiicola]TAA43656.1 hypothetical protein EXY25_13965 [Corallincola spongiicola]
MNKDAPMLLSHFINIPLVKTTLCGCALIFSTSLMAQDFQLMEESEIDERLSYLEARLNEIQTPSTYWQYGWTGFYGASALAQAYKANDEDDSDESTKQWVGAVKSTGGFAMMMLKPLPVVAGWDEYQMLPGNNRAEKLARLAEAEKMLEQSAWRADERYTLKPHLIGVGVNLLGAAAIAAWGDSGDALGSAALGIAISEAAIWTQPDAAREGWDGYQQQFNEAEKSAFNWRIVPGFNSVSLQVTF